MGLDVENYNLNRKKFSPLMVTDTGMVTGFWMIGNDYRNPSGYYGAYPPSYLKRMSLLFPHPDILLHLFSGKVKKGSWGRWPVKEVTFDCNESLHPDVCGYGESLVKELEPGTFDLILADSPYDEDYKVYGTPKMNKKAVIKQCSKILCPGGHLVWLDTIQPIWAKRDGWKLAGTIGLLQSTNHRVRVASIFEKV